MSIVATEKVSFMGHGEFLKKIKYTSKREMFSIDLPDWMAETIGRTAVWSTTETGVRGEFNKAYEEYKGLNTTKRKVIAYTVLIHAYIFDEDEICLLNRKDIYHFRGDCAFGIGYKVLTESVYNNKITYHDMDNRREDYINEEWVIIDWTEQREKFFKRTVKELETLILKVHNFFEDGKKLLNMIENNQFLLE